MIWFSTYIIWIHIVLSSYPLTTKFLPVFTAHTIIAFVPEERYTIQRTINGYGRYRTKNIMPPDAAEMLALEKNTEMRNACAIVEMP